MTLQETLKQNKEKFRQQEIKRIKKREMKELILFTFVTSFIVSATALLMCWVTV